MASNREADKSLAEKPHGYEFLGPYVSTALANFNANPVSALVPLSSPLVCLSWSMSSLSCATTSQDALHLFYSLPLTSTGSS